MEVNFKLLELVNAVPVLNKIAMEKTEFKLAYRIKRLMDKTTPVLKEFEKTREELIKKFGKIDDKGMITVPKEKHVELSKEMEPILVKEVVIEIEPVPFEMFEKANFKLSTSDLIILEKFITSPVEAKKEKKEENAGKEN